MKNFYKLKNSNYELYQTLFNIAINRINSIWL
jgi:hypothetical protein